MTDAQPCACPCCHKSPTVEQRMFFDDVGNTPPRKLWVVHCCKCPGKAVRRPAHDRETAVAEWNETFGGAV